MAFLSELENEELKMHTETQESPNNESNLNKNEAGGNKISTPQDAPHEHRAEDQWKKTEIPELNHAPVTSNFEEANQNQFREKGQALQQMMLGQLDL